MCVIIMVNREKAGDKLKELDTECIEVYCEDNNHGWGFMWYEDNRVKTINKMGNPQEAVETWNQFVNANIDFAFHCRLASMGDKTVENTHPVKIQNLDDGDPQDLYYMHNGTIQGVSVEKGFSDTVNYAKHFLRPLLKDYPDILRKDSFLDMLEAHIGFSKLVFLNSDGEWTIVNEDLGQEWKEGIWISNKGYPSKIHSYKYTSHQSPTENDQIAAAWMGGMKTTSGCLVNRQLPSATASSHDKTQGTWRFDTDERSHFDRIKVYGNNEMQWGTKTLEELLPDLEKFDEEGFFEFVLHNPYEATDSMYFLIQNNLEEFPKLTHKGKVELLMWAMGDPIDFSDELAICVLYNKENDKGQEKIIEAEFSEVGAE